MTYPRVRLIEPELEGGPGWYEVNDPTHKVVPLDALVIEPDGEDWSDETAQRMIDAVNPDLDVLTSRRFRLGLTMAKGMLDALEAAAQREGC